MKVGIAVLAISMALPGPAGAAPLRCTFSEKVQCDPGGTCSPLKPLVWLTIDLDTKKYSRCDRNGCDSYDAAITPSGAYTVIEVPGRAMFAKIGPNGQATEVVSLMNSVMVSQGVCR